MLTLLRRRRSGRRPGMRCSSRSNAAVVKVFAYRSCAIAKNAKVRFQINKDKKESSYIETV